MKQPLTTRGFTLLELLVAASITLVLAGLMLAVVTHTFSLWHRTQDSFSTAAQAGLVLDMAERDLQAATYRKDGGTWLAVDVISTPSSLGTHGWLTSTSAMKPATNESRRLVPVTNGLTPLISEARFGLSGAWLRFITTNIESGGSLPIAVSYQIARRPLSGAITAATQAGVRYTLFRAAVSSDNTFATGNDITAAGYASGSSAPAASRNAASLTNPNNTDALARNVVDFAVWLYVRDSTGGLRRIFPADNSDATHAAHDTGAAPDANRFPDVVDVMVRILTEQGADLLAEIESNAARVTRPANYASDAEWWWGVVEANSRVYTRRVEMKGTAP
jgi:prepilin-type N-terminal cleavage/methylation domain-containing protein